MAVPNVPPRRDAAQISALLDSPEITRLISDLQATRWTGRPGYPIRAMVGLALVKSVVVLVGELSDRVVEQDRVIAVQADRIAELQRRLGLDSSNSSRPPSSDAPWDKTRAKKRSSRTRSGRNPGKQPGAEGSSRSLVNDPDRVVVISPQSCGGCAQPLADGVVSGRSGVR